MNEIIIGVENLLDNLKQIDGVTYFGIEEVGTMFKAVQMRNFKNVKESKFCNKHEAKQHLKRFINEF